MAEFLDINQAYDIMLRNRITQVQSLKDISAQNSQVTGSQKYAGLLQAARNFKPTAIRAPKIGG